MHNWCFISEKDGRVTYGYVNKWYTYYASFYLEEKIVKVYHISHGLNFDDKDDTALTLSDLDFITNKAKELFKGV